MEEITLDDIDDPVFDLDTALVEGNMFALDGYVDLPDGMLLYEKDSTRRWWRFMCPTRWERASLRLEVDEVTSFSISDQEQLGTLILESVRIETDKVVLNGVVPCIVVVRSSVPRSTRILVSRASS